MRTCRTLPEVPVPAALAVPLGVRHQGRHQLQNVLFVMDIGEVVVVHRLFEVDRVENLAAGGSAPCAGYSFLSP